MIRDNMFFGFNARGGKYNPPTTSLNENEVNFMAEEVEIGSLKNIPVTLNFNKTGLSGSNLKDAAREIEILQNIRNDGKTMYVMDLETIGKIDGDVALQKQFTVLEAALSKVEFGFEKNKYTQKITNTHNILFGITEETQDALKTLVIDYTNGKELSPVEADTIKRLATIGSSQGGIVKSGAVKVGKELIDTYSVDMSGGKAVDLSDTGVMLTGINRLKAHGDRGYAITENKASKAWKLMNAYKQGLETAASQAVLVTQNGKVFDMPVLDLLMERHGEEKLDLKNHIDMFDLNKRISYDNIALHKLAGSGRLTGQARLEGFAEIFSKEIDNLGNLAHTAEYDVMITSMLMTTNIPGLNKPLLDEYASKVQELLDPSMNDKVSVTTDNIENARLELRAVDSLQVKTLEGERVKDAKDFSMDFLYKRGKTVLEEEETFKRNSNTVKKGHYYAIEKIVKVGVDELEVGLDLGGKEEDTKRMIKILKDKGIREFYGAVLYDETEDILSFIGRESEEKLKNELETLFERDKWLSDSNVPLDDKFDFLDEKSKVFKNRQAKNDILNLTDTSYTYSSLDNTIAKLKDVKEVSENIKRRQLFFDKDLTQNTLTKEILDKIIEEGEIETFAHIGVNNKAGKLTIEDIFSSSKFKTLKTTTKKGKKAVYYFL